MRRVQPGAPEPLKRSTAATEGPTDDTWWTLIIERKEDSVVTGRLAVRGSWHLRSFEIGFDLTRDAGDAAAEAVDGLVRWLFDAYSPTRIAASVHPDDVASAMVLERNGFIREGRLRNAHWDGDDNSDALIYGLTPADWQAWTGRPRTPPESVTLVPIDHRNGEDVYWLSTHWSQRRFVAPMEWSFADALIPELVNGAPVVPWMRAVEADGDLVGFVMLALPTKAHPDPYLWRLLIDRRHQRRGIGRRVLDLVVEQCRGFGATSLTTSWSQGRGTPEPFYLAYGFEPTGNLIDDEIEARLRW